MFAMEFTEAWDDTCSSVGMAARLGKFKDLCRLIQNGYPVDVADNRGWRPLHEAAALQTDTKCLEELLKHDRTNVNWKTHEGETALLLACKRRQGRRAEKAVDLLLHAGGDANIADNEEETPLLAATRAGEYGVITRLLNSGFANPNFGDCSGWRPLHEVATRGHIEMMRCLLRSEASIEVQDECGMTPVFTAAQHGQTECLKELLRIATERGQKKLIDLGAEDWATPLMIAAQQGFTTCVQILLDHDANPNLRTCDFATALHMAVEGKHADCLKLLLDRMDLQSLIESFHLRMRAELQNCLKFICPLHLAVEWKSYECLKMLLLAGFSANSVYDRENVALDHMYILPLPIYETALSYAVYKEDIESLKILLDYGASANAVCDFVSDDDGMRAEVSYPPVLRALFNASWSELDLLIEHGCDISYHRDDVPSNECLLISFFDYKAAKKLLLCGSDPHFCFRKRSIIGQTFFVDCLSSIASAGKQDIVLKILELLLQFTAITGPVQSSFYAVSARCVEIFSTQYNAEAWNAVLRKIDQPSSLKNLSRIRIRQFMISLQGYSSFRTAMSRLCLPHTLKDYLLYSELE